MPQLPVPDSDIHRELSPESVSDVTWVDREPRPAADAVVAASAETDVQAAPREVGVAGPRLTRSAPPWLVSFLVHAALMIALALSTVAVREYRPMVTIDSAIREDQDQFDEFELAKLEPQQEELQEAAPQSLSASPLAAMDMSDLAAELESQSLSLEVPVLDSTLGQIESLFENDQLGMKAVGAGKGAAMFFGVRAKGRRFVYVVDNSNSMAGGKFETAVEELLASVQGLYEDQYFYVVFFSDTAYPMFHPQPAQGMVKATEENIDKLRYWLESVQRCLRTDGKDAMQLALRLQPDAIYLLGDGAFTDNTVDQVVAANVPNLTIHTLGFGMQDKARAGFELIAQRYRGKFTEVEVTPAMRRKAQQLNRPRNRTRNGVWGIKLPAEDKKKRD